MTQNFVTGLGSFSAKEWRYTK